MIARTSAKSRLIRPGIVMMSLMPWTPWRSTSSTTLKASMMVVFFWTTSLSRSFGIVMSVSTWALSSSAAFSATSLRLAPSKRERLGHDADGQRARLLRDLGHDRSRAGPGPATETRGDEDHVRVGEGLGDLLGVLLRRALADRGVAAGTEAAGDLVADPDLVRRVGLEERLGVRVAGDELDAHHLGPDHPVDGVAAAAADADDADQREVLGIGTQRHRLPPGDLWSVVAGGRHVAVRWRWPTDPADVVQAGSARGRGSIPPARYGWTARVRSRACRTGSPVRAPTAMTRGTQVGDLADAAGAAGHRPGGRRARDGSCDVIALRLILPLSILAGRWRSACRRCSIDALDVVLVDGRRTALGESAGVRPRLRPDRQVARPWYLSLEQS